RYALRMPSLAPLLAHRRVLRAADRRNGHVAAHADVAADALADVVDASLLDLPREERVGDARPRRADEVEHAAAHLVGHRVGRGEPPHADDRLRGALLHPADERLLRALAREPRRDGGV